MNCGSRVLEARGLAAFRKGNLSRSPSNWCLFSPTFLGGGQDWPLGPPVVPLSPVLVGRGNPLLKKITEKSVRKGNPL